MKRKSEGPPLFSFPLPDVRTSIGDGTLKGIGIVSLGWNEVESLVDMTLPLALCINSTLWIEITSRINGFDGKIAIIKTALRSFGTLDDTIMTAISMTLGRVEELKKFRDGIVHVKIIDPESSIAQTHHQRGRVFETLVDGTSLDALYEHIRAVSRELVSIHAIVFTVSYFKRHPERVGEVDQSDLDHQINRYVTELKDFQKARGKLKPLPQFPT